MSHAKCQESGAKRVSRRQQSQGGRAQMTAGRIDVRLEETPRFSADTSAVRASGRWPPWVHCNGMDWASRQAEAGRGIGRTRGASVVAHVGEGGEGRAAGSDSCMRLSVAAAARARGRGGDLRHICEVKPESDHRGRRRRRRCRAVLHWPRETGPGPSSSSSSAGRGHQLSRPRRRIARSL